MSSAVHENRTSASVPNAYDLNWPLEDAECQLIASHKKAHIRNVVLGLTDSPALRTIAMTMVDDFLKRSGDHSSKIAVFPGDDAGAIELVIQVDSKAKRLEFILEETRVTPHAVTAQCVYSQPTARRPYNAERLFEWLLNDSTGRPDS